MYTWRHYAEMAIGGPVPAEKEKAYKALYERTRPLLGLLFWDAQSSPRFAGDDLHRLLVYMVESTLPIRESTIFVMAVLRAVPVPDLPCFTDPIFQGNGEISAYHSRQAVAMLWECFSIVSGTQQSQDQQEVLAESQNRIRTLLREIVRSVTGEEIQFVPQVGRPDHGT